MDAEQFTGEMIETGKKLYQRQLIVATEGNFSIRLDESQILTTPTGVCKGDLTPDDLVIVDPHGNHLRGHRKASTEILLHLEVYQQRPDVQAVMHAHPPYCLALMLAGKKLDKALIAENVIFLGKIPVAPYARPSTPMVPASIRNFIRQTDCILLDRHGSLTAGKSLTEAFYKLEMMEHLAKCYLLALQTGSVSEFSQDEVRALMKLRETVYGINWPVISFSEEAE